MVTPEGIPAMLEMRSGGGVEADGVVLDLGRAR